MEDATHDAALKLLSGRYSDMATGPAAIRRHSSVLFRRNRSAVRKIFVSQRHHSSSQQRKKGTSLAERS